MNNQGSHKELRIILLPKGGYKIVIDSFSKNIIEFKFFSELSDLNNIDYNVVNTYCLTDVFTLIPSALYQESEINSYLQYSTTSSLQKVNLYSESVTTEKIEVAWGIDKNIESSLIEQFKGVKLNSFIASFLNKHIFIGKENKILSIFLSNQLLIVLVLEGKIQIINKFEISSIEDALYYHLLLLQSSQLDGENIKLQTGGDYSFLEEFIDRIKDYFIVVDRIVEEESNIENESLAVLEILKSIG